MSVMNDDDDAKTKRTMTYHAPTARSADGCLLGPCARDGGDGDWWGERHKNCTGSHHDRVLGEVFCTCDCHSFNKKKTEAST